MTTTLDGLDGKTRLRWENEIRHALLGLNKPGKGGPKACAVCGKPDTRNHKKLNDQNGAHGEAVLKAYPSQWRQLTRALEQKLDFKTKEQFNAQQTFLLGKLLLARMEHEAYEPTTNNANAISNKSLVLGVLAATFKMLGIEIPACPKAKDGTTDRPWSVLQLTEILNLELAKLHGVGTDVTVSEHPAEDEPEAEQKDGSEQGQPAEQGSGEGGVVVTDQQTGEKLDLSPGAVCTFEAKEPTPAEKALAEVKAGSQGGTLSM